MVVCVSVRSGVVHWSMVCMRSGVVNWSVDSVYNWLVVSGVMYRGVGSVYNWLVVSGVVHRGVVRSSVVYNWLVVGGVVHRSVVCSVRAVVTSLGSGLVDELSVLLNKVVKLAGKLLGVWVRHVIGNVAVASSHVSGADESLKSVDVLLEDVLSALKLVEGGLGVGVLLDVLVVVVNIGSVDDDSLELVVEVSVLLAEVLDLVLHLVDSVGELLIINLEGLLLEEVIRVDWSVVDGVDLDLLLEVLHMFLWLLGDDSDWDVNSLDNLVLDDDLLDDLDLSLDDDIVRDVGLDLLLYVLGFLDLLDDLNLDSLLDGNWYLHDDLDGDLNLDDILILVSSAAWHNDGDVLVLGHGSSLDNVVLDVLGLDSGGDLYWLTDSDISVSAVDLLEGYVGGERYINVLLFGVDAESVDWDNVGHGVLLLVDIVGWDLIFVGYGVWDLLDDGVSGLHGLLDLLVVVSWYLVLNSVVLVDWLLDVDLFGVGLLIVVEGWDLILNNNKLGFGGSLDVLVELVDGHVDNVSDEVNLVLWDLDNLLLGVKSDVSLKDLIDVVVLLEVMELSNIDLDNSLLSGALAVKGSDLVLDNLGDWDIDDSLDLNELFLILNSWDLDNLLDLELDDLLNWDLLDNLDDHLLLDDFLHLFGNPNVIRGVNIFGDGDPLLNDNVDWDLLNLLNDDSLLLVLCEVSLLDVMLLGGMTVGDGLTFLVSGVDVVSLNPSLLNDSTWSSGLTNNVGVAVGGRNVTVSWGGLSIGVGEALADSAVVNGVVVVGRVGVDVTHWVVSGSSHWAVVSVVGRSSHWLVMSSVVGRGSHWLVMSSVVSRGSHWLMVSGSSNGTVMHRAVMMINSVGLWCRVCVDQSAAVRLVAVVLSVMS